MSIQCHEAKSDLEAAKDAARRTLDRAEKVLVAEPDHGGTLGFSVTALATLHEAERAKDWTERAMLVDPDNRSLHIDL